MPLLHIMLLALISDAFGRFATACSDFVPEAGLATAIIGVAAAAAAYSHEVDGFRILLLCCFDLAAGVVAAAPELDQLSVGQLGGVKKLEHRRSFRTLGWRLPAGREAAAFVALCCSVLVAAWCSF